jgi:transposase
MATRKKQTSEAAVREIRRKTRRRFAPEEKIRIVLNGLRGEQSISELCRREGIASNLYYRWSKDFLEGGKKQLAGDTVREAPSDEVTDLRSENRELKEVVAEITLRYRILKSWMTTRATSSLGSSAERWVPGLSRTRSTTRSRSQA